MSNRLLFRLKRVLKSVACEVTLERLRYQIQSPVVEANQNLVKGQLKRVGHDQPNHKGRNIEKEPTF